MSGLTVPQQVLASQEYTALKNWLSGETAEVGDVLDDFCQPVENKFFDTQSAEDAQGLLWSAWQAVVGEAATTPYTSQHRQKLVDLMVSLTSRPTLSKGDSTCKIDDMTVWRDLPVFGWQLREAWNLGTLQSFNPIAFNMLEMLLANPP